MNHDLLLHVAVRPLRHLNFQFAEFGEDRALYRRDLAGIPNVHLIAHSRTAGHFERQLRLRGIPRFGENAQTAAGAAQRREFIRKRQAKIVLHADDQIVRSVVDGKSGR